jgi:2-polyprenyl-3-methyl-5-hydroxy-6-metoxy-1,4-benzoquinol methylase
MPIRKNRDRVVSGYGATSEEYAADSKNALKAGERSRERFVAALPERGSILDVGCGAGWEAKWFADRGFKVLALDPTENLINLAKSDHRGVDFRIGTIEDVKKSDGPFDGIWCNRVFQHLHSEERPHFLTNAAALLKTGGMLYLSACMTELDHEAPIMAHYIPRHDVSETGLMELAADAGFMPVFSQEWGNAPPWKEFLLRNAQ